MLYQWVSNVLCFQRAIVCSYLVSSSPWRITPDIYPSISWEHTKNRNKWTNMYLSIGWIWQYWSCYTKLDAAANNTTLIWWGQNFQTEFITLKRAKYECKVSSRPSEYSCKNMWGWSNSRMPTTWWKRFRWFCDRNTAKSKCALPRNAAASMGNCL